MTRRTKIVATLGPATDPPGVLDAVIEAGVDVVRLNLSHGTLAEHLERLAAVRASAERAGVPVGVLADLPGPKVRSGRFAEGGVHLEAGDPVDLRPGSTPSDQRVITVDYPHLAEDTRIGDRIALGDGAVSLRVRAVIDDTVSTVVESGGRVQGRPGVHLSGDRMRLVTPTAEDLELADAVCAAGVDFVAVSFVRAALDVERVREVVGARARIVAKIETGGAVGALDSIIAVSDAVMVARGDLGIDLPLEDVPHLQKQIIRTCVEAGVPVITATQMLESMISAPTPTRAEVSDVANAVVDGTDAVMLSGETAIGHAPAEVVATMARITRRAEQFSGDRNWAEWLVAPQQRWGAGTDRVTSALAHAAASAAVDVGAAAILCCTRTGRTARAMARFRPAADLIGLSPDPATVAAMTLMWGVDPIGVDTYTSTDDMVWFAVERAVSERRVHPGDTVVVLAGAPDRASDAAADVLRIVTVT